MACVTPAKQSLELSIFNCQIPPKSEVSDLLLASVYYKRLNR